MATLQKTTFALFFGNRGFFPASLQKIARRELVTVLEKAGHRTLALPEDATRYGAVETPREGEVYAEFLRQHRGEFGGVILCLPNFGDETGAVAALQDAGVPILVQAYPDDLDKMAPATRRDAFCGKFSVMDVFVQYGVKFTALTPHTVHPASPAFAANLDHFDRVCRVVNGMRGMIVGAVGARTTPFKTVRFDEIALQKHGVTVETLDLSDVFARVRGLKSGDRRVKAKTRELKGASCWQGVPSARIDTLARLGVVLDDIIADLRLDALALRCWTEMQQQFGVSPCVVMGLLNERGVSTACEVDVCNAVTMHALHLASGGAAGCLDLNNNYADAPDKMILFHCGPMPASLMAGKGRIADHAILANAVGEGCGFGCNTGRIAPGPFTFGSMLTRDGSLQYYLGEGRFTADPIAADFFGCAGVAEVPGLQEKLLVIGRQGHRHHTSVAAGHVAAAMREAFEQYLGYQVTML
jgi:L-fucose isomerase-like protein